MRVLIVDQEMTGLDLAMRAREAEHEVRWFRNDGRKPTRVGEGIVPPSCLIDNWQESMKWARDGLIIGTGNYKYVHDFDRYREYGYKIFGPTVKSSRLEIDREAGMSAMRAADISIPEYHIFNSLEESLAFARRHDKAYVFKPMGDEVDKALTYVSDDQKDIVGWIQRKIAAGKKMQGKCMLQEKIDLVCELGVSGWMGPDGFLPNKWQVCIEHKKLMNGEVGPSTGEMGTVCQYVYDDKLAEQMLRPMESALRVLGHTGDFAVGCGIDKNGRAWPFEWTARLGWPAFWIQLASHRGDPVQWMHDLLHGKDTLRVTYDVAIGVVVAQPQFPYDLETAREYAVGNYVDLSTVDRINIHPMSMMREGGQWKTAGSYVLVATATGKTITTTRRKVYDTIDGVKLPDKIYRTDIGEKIEKPLPFLHKHGYAKELFY